LMRTVTDQRTPRRVSVSMSAEFQNPASARMVNAPVAPARRTRAMLLGEARGAPLGGSLAEPGVNHLAGVGPGGQQRVVAEDLRVAVGGTVLVLADEAIRWYCSIFDQSSVVGYQLLRPRQHRT
jgi:hypothetical protein